MANYKTIWDQGICEQVIERSRFIGHSKFVCSKKDADAFFSEIRNTNKTATHNVPALVIGDNFQLQWASDDGEPQGTSGAPIVQMMVKEGLTNIAVMVTRYFGGIKLGTGGLLRAYTGTAKLAIEAAGICMVRERCRFDVKIGYAEHNKLQSLSSKESFVIRDTQYSDKVFVGISTAPENEDKVLQLLADITMGTFELVNQSMEKEKTALLEK